MKPRKIPARHTEYGELVATPETAPLIEKAQKLLLSLRKKGQFSIHDTIAFDRKHRASGSARHLEIYDAQLRPFMVLVCDRETEGSKYGVRTVSKDYFAVSKKATIPVSKGIAAKAAKSASYLGDALKIVLGGAKLPAPEIHTEEGFKLVLPTETPGVFRSVFNGSRWEIGKPRTQSAKEDHEGGFYFYRNLPAALEATKKNQVFNPDKDHSRLAILRVRVSGRVIEYSSGKFAGTKLLPLEEIGATI